MNNKIKIFFSISIVLLVFTIGCKKSSPSGRKIKFYRNPMEASVTSPVPMKDSMGMDYIPVYEDEKEEETENAVEGRSPIKISADKEQLIGVRTALVERKDFSFPVRASGSVAYDPELYNALTEYREAVASVDKLKEKGNPEATERAKSLANASLLKLKQMGLSEKEIQKQVSEGANSNLLVGSNDAVWVYAQVYQQDAAVIKEGQRMDVTSSALPGQTFHGRVSSLDTVLNSETRSLRIRAEVKNPNGFLKPQMFVDVTIYVNHGRKLSLPKEALMDTGVRQIVFVRSSKGVYDPREVKVGYESDDFYEVISGVEEGEMVVTSANFLIDSESKLKAAIKK